MAGKDTSIIPAASSQNLYVSKKPAKLFVINMELEHLEIVDLVEIFDIRSKVLSLLFSLITQEMKYGTYQ